MTPVGAIVLGFGLGLRHATDADHVLIVSALLKRQCRPRQAALVAAWWGVGHSLSVFTVGLPLIVLDLRLPQGFAVVAEVLVAVMLIGFGGRHLVRKGPLDIEKMQTSAPPAVPAVRALMVGAVHGLAGSAAIALLASAALENRVLAVSCLLLFGFGTVCGMVLLTALLARPLAWANGHRGIASRITRIAAAALSIGLGGYLLVNIVLGSTH